MDRRFRSDGEEEIVAEMDDRQQPVQRLVPDGVEGADDEGRSQINEQSYGDMKDAEGLVAELASFLECQEQEDVDDEIERQEDGKPEAALGDVEKQAMDAPAGLESPEQHKDEGREQDFEELSPRPFEDVSDGIIVFPCADKAADEEKDGHHHQEGDVVEREGAREIDAVELCVPHHDENHYGAAHSINVFKSIFHIRVWERLA